MSSHTTVAPLALADRNRVLRFVDMGLRGASQVFFQDNPITGLFVLAGVFWATAVTGMICVGIGALVGLMTGTATAVLLRSDEASLRKGMFGFNPILVGIAVPTFLRGQSTMWLYLVIGTAAAHVVTLAVGALLKPYGVAASTAPFVFTSWLLMLGAYNFAGTPASALSTPALPRAVQEAAAQVPLTPAFLVQTLFRNISQVFLLKSVVAGILFIVGIAFSSVRAAVFAVVGSVIAMLTALVFGADGGDLARGLFGFSPVLTAMALGATFLRPSWRVTAYASFGTMFTVIVQAGMDVLVTPFGVPSFTMPYVLTMWLFMLPTAGMQPTSHSEPKGEAVAPVFPTGGTR
jgi:urea transporter